MKYLWKKYCLVIWLITLIAGVCCSWDPYKVLNLKRSSSTQEIRRAYKQCAKEWHPDKNKKEEAEAKFVEINKAYELLSDPVRRKLYDQKGIVDDSLNRENHEQNAYNGYREGQYFTQHGGFRFQFKMSEMNFFHEHSITIRSYENLIVPQSQKQPYLILIFSEWCLMCLHVMPMWQHLVEDLHPIGINLVTVNYDREVNLAQKLGARRAELPHISLVMESRVSSYKGDEYNTVKIIEFIRSRFSRSLISGVSDENADHFLAGWRDNKVRVLLFGKLELVRLRYLTLAFKYRSYCVFGYAQLNLETTRNLSEKFDIPPNLDSLLLFHEDQGGPAAKLSMVDLPYATLKDLIEANKYLQLPRLSSQNMMDSLCPPESSYIRRRLCAILVTDDKDDDNEARQQLRQFTRQFKFSRDRIALSYIYSEKQIEFLRTLVEEGKSLSDIKNHIVVVWRQDVLRVSYTWLTHPFIVGNDNWNTSLEYLQRTLTKLLGSSQPLSHQTLLKELVDENAQGLFGRILTRFVAAGEALGDRITRQEVLAVGSVIGTVLFIAAVGYVMTYLVRLEEEAIQKKTKCTQKITKPTITELKLHELRSETYNGMVRLLKPGCRTIVLLLDNQCMDVLIPKFHKAVWPYRKNKSLLFGWMSIDRGLQWYSRLLNLALKNVDEDEGSEITLDSSLVNSKNCVGTIISLNGHRRYFCIYHARHPECLSDSGGKRMQNMALRLTKSNSAYDNNSGAFMGFDTSCEDSETSDVEKGANTGKALDEEPLITNGLGLNGQRPATELALDGVSNWLDRLFEGTTQRYYINYWPDFGNF